MKKKTSVEKLVEILRKEGFDIKDPYTFVRCRPGKWQRMRWCWSWCIVTSNFKFGSWQSVGEMLKCKRFTPVNHMGQFTGEILGHPK